MIVSYVSERKAAKVAAMVSALAALRLELALRARELGGRYLLIGSAARGELRFSSDIDLLLDFPDHAATTAAWTFAETRGAELGLNCDVRPVAYCGDAFLDHVMPEAQTLP